jgi:hypothetical protein
MVHDGDTYFERCFGADYDPRVTPEQKEGCWAAWTAHYTKHQPAHRVDYALARIEAIQSGEHAPTLPGLGSGAVKVETAQVDDERASAETASSNSGSSLLMPMTASDAGPVPNGCLHFCNQYESRCNASCPGGNTACRLSCERERAFCLNGCH